MKELINVNYRAIFKYPEHKETVTYNEIASYSSIDDKTSIVFDVDGQHLEIHLLEDTVFLINNQTNLKLVKDKRIRNEYHSHYGTMELYTKLDTFEYGETIKIKYQLFDQESLLNEVYILITMKTLEN